MDGHTIGEVKALVAPFLEEQAEDLEGIIVIGMDRKGNLSVFGNHADPWSLAGLLGQVLMQLADRERQAV
jgi:hypothetical protein